MKEFQYTIKDPAGIHARPAGEIVKEAGKFISDVTIKANGKEADAKKLMRLMGLGIKRGTELTVCIEGEDEEKALEALKDFFEQNIL